MVIKFQKEKIPEAVTTLDSHTGRLPQVFRPRRNHPATLRQLASSLTISVTDIEQLVF